MEDSLTNAVNVTMNQKEEVIELSWCDLHKWEVFLLVIIVSAFGIGILIYKYRK